ncbi:MAG: hypothetical protein PHN19_05465 [Patescibacteria group bacterium]|nr:hypothetical protein [Patescibacteria group bacterium]
MFKKRKLIYNCSGQNIFDFSHCHKPTPLVIDNNVARIYFGTRDRVGITRTTFIDVDFSNLQNPKINYIHNKPVLDVGKIGTFDDSGANVSSILKIDSEIIMYYIGWNPSTTVHTRNSIGVSISKDNGLTFKRIFDGSILDRDKLEPYYTGAVDVVFDKMKYQMWYTSGSKWKIINNKPEIFYHIKYAESKDGIDWKKRYVTCIPPKNSMEVTARPCVIKEDGIYKMWYSKRNIDNFRKDKRKNYRGGYAESKDGIDWERKDSSFKLKPSEKGWDSEAIAYPYVFKVNKAKVMLYNGNGFGKTGFGYALYEE